MLNCSKMEESKTNLSIAPGKKVLNPFALKKPKKRSLVERELETNLTARITSPVTTEGVSTSRYGRPRRSKIKNDNDGVSQTTLKSPGSENTPVKVQSLNIKELPNYQLKTETPKKALKSTLDNIDNIYHENKSLSRFTKDEIQNGSSSVKKSPKLYIRKDLIQNRDDDDDGIVLIKDLFSSPKPGTRPLIHSSSKKYSSNQNGHFDNKSVVKTLDFDGGKKTKENKDLKVTVKNEPFGLEANSPYQVGDLAWARMGTFPFWPCIVTKDPSTDMFVKKKLFGRVEHFILHVTFFADNGRRSWVVDNMLRKYLGPEEFICTREKFTPEDKKKDPRLYAAFFISEKKQSLWNASVEEAEIINRAPRRLRIDVFNDMIHRARATKKQKGGKITRTDSDVSLSESLYDSLFSDDDNKTDDANRSKTKNIKIDVSDVVTACLDNMAAKTGNIKIQRQSHMDRWLQKAKSKTPEKVKTEKGLPIAPVTTQGEQMVTSDSISIVDIELKPKVENNTPKIDRNRSKKKKLPPKDVKITKVYKLRRSYEAQNALCLEQSECEILSIKDEFNCKLTDKNLDMEDIRRKEDFSNNLNSADCNGLIPKLEPIEYENPHDSKDLNIKTELLNLASMTDKSTIKVLNEIDDFIDDKQLSKGNEGSVPDLKSAKTAAQLNQSNNESNPTSPDEISAETAKVQSKEESHPIYLDDKSAETACITQEVNHSDEPKAMEVDECLENCVDPDNIIALLNGTPEVMVIDNDMLSNNCQEISQNPCRPAATDKNDQVHTLMPRQKNASKRDYQVDSCMLVHKDDNSPSITVNDENNLTTLVEIEMDCNVKNSLINVTRPCENENQNIGISSVEIVNRICTNESTLISVEGVSNKQKQEAVQSDNSDANEITNHSPRFLKGNQMVLIPELDLTNSDSNSNEKEYNVQEMTDVQDHNSNIKNSVIDTKQMEPTKLQNLTISDPNAKLITTIHENLKDIKMNDKCDFVNESGHSESILQTYLLDDDTSNANDDMAEKNNIEIKPVKDTVAQRIDSNPFIDDSKHVVPIDNDSVNKFFRDVNKSKPPDLKSDNLLAKAELLKSVVEPTIEFCEDEDSSDDEPSPEYEPLGEEITEDFRQHMKCIQSIITDKNDEAQLVKVCNEIAVIEESKTKIADSILKIKEIDMSLTSPVKENQNVERKETKPKLLQSETEPENVNDMAEKKINIYDAMTSKINGVVRQPTDMSISLTKAAQCHKSKEIKTELINLHPDKSVEIKSESNGNLKPQAGKNKCSLSLKKKKSLTENDRINESTLLNVRYKTIDQIEEIIQKNIEPKILPIENGEVNIAILNEAAYTTKREFSDTPDLPPGDDDFNIDDVSVNSEDSDISLSLPNTHQHVSRRNLRLRPEKKGGLENPDFLKYLELNQDSWMEQHPDLSHDDIVCYLYKIFLYQENLKSDDKVRDVAEPSNLSKGVKQEPPDVQQLRTRKKSKKSSQPKNTIENLFREKYKNAKKIDLDTRSDVAMFDSNDDCEPKREIVSPVDSGIGNSKDSNESTISTIRKAQLKSPVQRSLTPEITKEVKEELIHEVDTQETDKPSTSSAKTPKSKKNKSISPRITQKTGDKRIPVVVISPLKQERITKREPDTENESVDSDSELPLRQLRSKVLHEKNFNEFQKEMLQQNVKEEETASVSSENEPLVKPKTKKVDKSLENTYQDPEFVKYLELRQDAIIDENPQLSSNEIQAYLYKSWLYENNSKSELQVNEEIESSNLVKGLTQDPVPQRKVRRKVKTEKTDVQDVDDVIPKQKPRRKTIKHYFNEDFMSDIEDELDVFEIFKTGESPITVVSKAENDKHSPKKEIKTEKPVKSEDEDDDEKIAEVINTEDEIELYYKQLITPKPSVFKGLIREKVCGICEDISNLIKCKGCNEMFHYDCVVAKEMESPKTVQLKKKRGRKSKTVRESENNDEQKTARDENSDERCQDLSEENISMEDECANTSSTKIKKKRRSRKHKSLLDSENSDERSHDISEEYVCIEDITGCTFDAATVEAQLEAKMKEVLEDQELNYDSYSSDDGIEWTECVPGQCEIVDVKLKKRTPPTDHSNFKCNNCKKYDIPVCFVCKSAVSKTGAKYRQKCNTSHCHNFYHLECLDHWPQTQFNAGELTGKKQRSEAFTCPRHVCHTCVCDDPRGCKTRFIGDKLAKCVRCPATYHAFNRCLPAGTQILTASLIICPRHYEHRPGKITCHVNTGWCFICALGGSLICCEYCPTSFHAECLNIKPPEGNYMCEDCETGRLPLYGEMVWVKLGQYRWWPGIILHPSEIPDNIMAVNHGLGEFVVRFFGQYDHYWVNRGRVFPYQEGDSGRISGQKSKIDADFTIAMEHAQRAAKILKNAPPGEDEEAEISASLLPPHYIKLKSNKPIGSLCGRKMEDPSLSLTQCECNPADVEPCGPNSQCLNRMLLTECGPTCRAGERCNNRAFEKRQYPKLTPYRASHRGWGLKTLENIKAGQFVIEYVGELIDEEEFRRRMTRKHEIRDENFYFLTLDKERMIDAGPKGNLARFMNHCCEPNCETQKWTVLGDIRVGLFAIDDIPANSEVTFNYNLECTGIEKKRCLCGAKRCSGYIGAKPKQIDESQKKLKNGVAKRTYKKRKNLDESPTTSRSKTKKPVGRPPKPKELTEIEKDLLIIKSASGDESRISIEDKLRNKKIESPIEEVSNSNVIEPSKLLKKKLDLNLKEESSTLNEPDTKALKKKSASIKEETLSLIGPDSNSGKKLDSNSKHEDSISIADDAITLNKETDCPNEDVSLYKETKPNRALQKKLNSLKEETPITNGPRTLKRKVDPKERAMANGVESKSVKRKLSNAKAEVLISNEPSSKRRKCIEVGD